MHARPEWPGGPTGGGVNKQTPLPVGPVLQGVGLTLLLARESPFSRGFTRLKSNLNPWPLTPERQGNFLACSAATGKC